MAADVGFVKRNLASEEVVSALQDWNCFFGKAIGRSKAVSKEMKNLCTARSVARQSIESISHEKHGHIWCAMHGDKICAVLVADDRAGELVIRFLVANLRDPEAKGSGAFLVQNMLELARKTHATVRTTPENAEKFWRDKMGFQEDPKDPVQYIYNNPPNPNPANAVHPKRQHNKR